MPTLHPKSLTPQPSPCQPITNHTTLPTLGSTYYQEEIPLSPRHWCRERRRLCSFVSDAICHLYDISGSRLFMPRSSHVHAIDQTANSTKSTIKIPWPPLKIGQNPSNLLLFSPGPSYLATNRPH